MISSIVRLLLFRVLGARVLLLLTVLGWIRNRLRGRRPEPDPRRSRTDGLPN